MAPRTRYHGRSRRTLVVLVLLSITALTFDLRGSSGVDWARGQAVDNIRPVDSAVGGVFKPLENVWNGIFHYQAIKKENDELRAQLAELQGREATVAAKENDIKTFQSLLGIPWVGDIPTVTANVVGARPSNFDQTVQIDKGTADGIRFGYPVVTGAGLVGRVVRVSNHAASVRLITDPAFTAGVQVAGDATALLRGEGPGSTLNVELAQKPKSASESDGASATLTVAIGAVVTTSGQDISLFPKDLPVGVVVEVSSPPESGNLVIRVSPAADLSHLSLVKVLRWDPPNVRP